MNSATIIILVVMFSTAFTVARFVAGPCPPITDRLARHDWQFTFCITCSIVFAMFSLFSSIMAAIL